MRSNKPKSHSREGRKMRLAATASRRLGLSCPPTVKTKRRASCPRQHYQQTGSNPKPLRWHSSCVKFSFVPGLPAVLCVYCKDCSETEPQNGLRCLSTQVSDCADRPERARRASRAAVRGGDATDGREAHPAVRDPEAGDRASRAAPTQHRSIFQAAARKGDRGDFQGVSFFLIICGARRCDLL